MSLTTAQEKALADLRGLEDQIYKQHFLNVHFRAFELAYEAWREHIRLNAVTGSRKVQSPAGAVLDNERDDQ